MRADRLLAAGVALVASGCSLIDGNFNECSVDGDCPGGHTCETDPLHPSERVCIQVPEGCFGVPVAGTVASYGDVDAGTLHVGLDVNLTSSSGVNSNKVEGLNAIWMALDEINQNAGTGKQTFVLHVCDNATDKTRIPVQMDWMLNQKGVQAVLVTGSSNEITASQSTLPAGALIMSPSATSPAITSLARTTDGGFPLLWRTAPSDVLQGRVVADLLLGSSPYDAGPGLAAAPRVGIIYSNESYGTGLEQVIQDRFTTSTDGGRRIDAFGYTLGGDVTQAVLELANFEPQVTVCIGQPGDAENIVNAALQYPVLTAAMGHRWVFTDAAKDPAILHGKDPSQVANAIGTAPAQGAGAAYPSFSQRFINRFAVDPSNYSYTSQSYDAMYLVALGASMAVGTNGDQAPTGVGIAQGLTRVSDPSASLYRLQPSDYIGARVDLQAGKTIHTEGASGDLLFDPTTGESPAPIELWGVAPGEGGFQTLMVVTPPSS